MADTFKYVQAQNFSLAGSGVVIGATTVILKSFAGIDGTLLTMTDFGTIGFGTLEPGNGTLEEQISFTGVTQNANGTATLTGVSNVTFISPYTATSGVLKTHAGSTTFVISNTSGFYDRLTGKGDDETITGRWIFPDDDVNNAGIGSDVDTTIATAFVTLGQLSRQAISGASNASTTVKGIVELATQAEVDARTTTGATGALLVPTPERNRTVLTHDSITSAVGTDAYAIACVPAVTAYTTGDVYHFKADVANTGACTLAVNGLSAIPLLINTTLTPPNGYIKAGSMVECMYDGANMQIMSVAGTAQLSQSFKEVYGASGGGTDAYSITVAPVPIALAAGQVFLFKADVANVTAASLTVNGLGPMDILRADGTTLLSGDIAANQIVEVAVYDGSTCKMLSPVAVANTPKYTNGTDVTRTLGTASGDLVLAHGLGKTPRYVKITMLYGAVAATGSSIGVYNGSTVSTTWLSLASGTQPAVDNTNILRAVSASATPNTQTATIAVDATNITLTFTKGGSNGTEAMAILWEAQC